MRRLNRVKFPSLNFLRLLLLSPCPSVAAARSAAKHIRAPHQNCLLATGEFRCEAISQRSWRLIKAIETRRDLLRCDNNCNQPTDQNNNVDEERWKQRKTKAKNAPTMKIEVVRLTPFGVACRDVTNLYDQYSLDWVRMLSIAGSGGRSWGILTWKLVK